MSNTPCTTSAQVVVLVYNYIIPSEILSTTHQSLQYAVPVHRCQCSDSTETTHKLPTSSGASPTYSPLPTFLAYLLQLATAIVPVSSKILHHALRCCPSIYSTLPMFHALLCTVILLFNTTKVLVHKMSV